MSPSARPRGRHRRHRSGHHRCRPVATVVLLAAAAVLAACTGGGATPPGDPFPPPGDAASAADVDVGTPALRAQRRAAGIATCPRTEPAAGPYGGGLPDVTLPCLGDGPDVAMAALRGPLVVNLWAQWCGPCRRELPYFARLHAAGVDVLGVDFQDTRPDAALEMAEQSGVTYASVADVDGELRAPLRIAAVPTTVFVDPDGRVTRTLAQEFSSYEELVAAVEEHLGVRP